MEKLNDNDPTQKTKLHSFFFLLKNLKNWTCALFKITDSTMVKFFTLIICSAIEEFSDKIPENDVLQ